MMGDKDTTRGAINSAGVIKADGHARVQVGDSFSIVHNYPDPNRHPADPHLTTTDKAKLRTDFLRRLYASPYEDRKNRNPKRADGTCEWFTAHRLFENWQKETSSLLWVSADPGCGKSVLTRYLVDDLFSPSSTRTTCYFFFKDDFEDQRVLESAFCCILHQLFTQEPDLLSDEILEDFREKGDQFFTSFAKLWETLTGATRTHNHGEILCILDALDECVNRKPLVESLTRYYGKGKATSTLKFLVTSRPYLHIQRGFHDLEKSHPTIHLSGENQDEMDKIAQEIAITIDQRIAELCERHRLSIEEKQILQCELTAVNNRTYLWIHLVFDVVEKAVMLSKRDLIATIRNLPRTVEEAYDNILRKSPHLDKAKKVLQVIIAASRPLRLTEISIVLAFQKENHRCLGDLEGDLLLPERLKDMIREACGLFVVVQDSRVFLLHQTAKEFLVRSSNEQLMVRSSSLMWQHSLDSEQSHRLLSEICIRYLLLTDFEIPVEEEYAGGREDRRCFFDFHRYAACSWADHYRHTNKTQDKDLERLALQLCDTNSHACSNWLKVYGAVRMQEPRVYLELRTSLLIASHFGLDSLVNLILQERKDVLNTVGSYSRRSALSWASEKGYGLIVQSLLRQVPKHQVLLRDKLFFPLSPSLATIINLEDYLGKSPLSYAAANGHQSIVDKLLKRGAKVDTKDSDGVTPLFWATLHGYDGIVALLLKNGARQSSLLEVRDPHGQTPLLRATSDENKVVVQLLLKAGAQVDAQDIYGITALMQAAARGNAGITKLLLDNGAQVNIQTKDGVTALIWAASRGNKGITKLLLDSGAQVNIQNKDGATALMWAASEGDEGIIKLLLNSGAQVDIQSKDGTTALMRAASNGHKSIAKLLLNSGA